MFGLILLSAVTVMHVYVLWRAATVPFIRRHVTRKGLIAAGVLVWLVFLAGRFFGHDHTGSLASLLELSAMNWMAVLFLCAVSLLAVEIVTGFGWLFRAAAPKLRGAALACGLVLSLIAVVQGARDPVVQNYEVELPGLFPAFDDTVIVGLSDLHLGSTVDGKWLRQCVAQVQAARPDMIVLLGDIFEGHSRPSKEHLAALRGLWAPLGVWAVLGNHESHGRGNSLVSDFKTAGITVLQNEKRSPAPGLVLAGIDDLTSLRRSGLDSDPVKKTLGAPSANATILLSHTPLERGSCSQDRSRAYAVRTYARRAGLALRVSGQAGLSARRRTLRCGRHDGHRFARRGHLGSAHAVVGAGRDYPGDVACEKGTLAEGRRSSPK